MSEPTAQPHPRLSSPPPATAVSADSGPGLGYCASCGRFIGPYARCPTCGARATGRLDVRIIKVAALLLATVGLVGLWWLARHEQIPTLTLSEITGTMNLAYVRVSGRIARNLTYDPESGYLGFWLTDGESEIHVNAYEDVTTALLAAGTIPALGDEVTVAGTLRVREDVVALTVNVPDHLVLRRPEPRPLKAHDITLLDEGQRVQLTGEVSAIGSPYTGLTLVTLRDSSGEIVIAVDEVVTMLTGALPEIAVGQGISVAGTVSLYKTTPQIVPARTDDLVLQAVPPEPTVLQLENLAQLHPGDQGQRVRGRGQVVLLVGLPGGVKATLDDGTAQVVLLLWDSVYQSLAQPAALDVGAEVEVTGEAQVYEGQLEIIPDKAEEVAVLIPAQPAPWVEAGALTPADAGRVVRVRGVLATLKGFSAGVKAKLEDGTGEIEVVIWSDLHETLAPRPDAGQLVEVTGVIELYRGALQLVPRSQYDWHVRPPDD